MVVPTTWRGGLLHRTRHHAYKSNPFAAPAAMATTAPRAPSQPIANRTVVAAMAPAAAKSIQRLSMAASFRAQVIVPVFSLRAQALYIHIHILQHLHHVLAGVLTCLIVIKTEVHHIQLLILP